MEVFTASSVTIGHRYEAEEGSLTRADLLSQGFDGTVYYGNAKQGRQKVAGVFYRRAADGCMVLVGRA